MIRYRTHNPASQCSHNEGMFHVRHRPEAGSIDREHHAAKSSGSSHPYTSKTSGHKGSAAFDVTSFTQREIPRNSLTTTQAVAPPLR